MHSFGHRGNGLLTFAVTFLPLMCAMASLFDNLLKSPSPTTQIQVLNIDLFQKQSGGNDEVSITVNISADLKPLFTWNTKQISLWDSIIPSKDDAKFWVRTSNTYDFIDLGSNLRGKEFNLTLHWHVMPKTGKMFADKIVKSGYRLPEEYR